MEKQSDNDFIEAIMLRAMQGRWQEAERELRQAGNAGRANAQFALAVGYFEARFGTERVPEGLAALERAAALQHPAAFAFRAGIRLAGVALPYQPSLVIADWREAIGLGDKPAKDAWEAIGSPETPPQPNSPRVCHADPSIIAVPNALPISVCQRLCKLALAGLSPAPVMASNGSQSLHPIRTNAQAPLGVLSHDLVVRWAERRMSELAQANLTDCEFLGVLRYQPGEYYRPHLDALNPLHSPALFAPSAPGQRLRTIFVYLNAVAGGGETEFPNIGIKVSPEQGMALKFDNINSKGEIDRRVLHAGLSPQGEKWLATLWCRERPLRRW